VRRLTEAEAEAAGLSGSRAIDLVTAVNEVAANSIRHGGGEGELRSWRETGRLLVQIGDRGQITDPLAGRIRPAVEQLGGRGLWLANQLCDLVQIRSGSDGTVVRLCMALS
jgi:anti-sigma regulatory factor (Ser/Thr protein kinase)